MGYIVAYYVNLDPFASSICLLDAAKLFMVDGDIESANSSITLAIKRLDTFCNMLNDAKEPIKFHRD